MVYKFVILVTLSVCVRAKSGPASQHGLRLSRKILKNLSGKQVIRHSSFVIRHSSFVIY